MKNVRLENNIVVEIIPNEATPVKYWYGEEFAAQCVEAPDEVQQNWTYDGTSFTAPQPATPKPAEPTAEERLSAVESAIAAMMGV